MPVSGDLGLDGVILNGFLEKRSFGSCPLGARLVSIVRNNLLRLFSV